MPDDLDLLVIAPRGAAVVMDGEGRVEIVEDPTPRHPVVAGVRITPDALEVLRLARVSGLTLDELCARAEKALARWPDVLASYELPTEAP